MGQRLSSANANQRSVLGLWDEYANQRMMLCKLFPNCAEDSSLCLGEYLPVLEKYACREVYEPA